MRHQPPKLLQYTSKLQEEKDPPMNSNSLVRRNQLKKKVSNRGRKRIKTAMDLQQRTRTKRRISKRKTRMATRGKSSSKAL